MALELEEEAEGLVGPHGGAEGARVEVLRDAPLVGEGEVVAEED